MATGNLIEDQIAKKLMLKIAGQMNLDEMAKRLAPKIKKEVEKRIMVSVLKIDFTDEIWDCLPHKQFEEMMKKCFIDALKK